ncbi:MAG: hypothetical protein WKG07_04740 [Hymenobacter sp.]
MQRAVDYALAHNLGVRLNQLTAAEQCPGGAPEQGRAAAHGQPHRHPGLATSVPSVNPVTLAVSERRPCAPTTSRRKAQLVYVSGVSAAQHHSAQRPLDYAGQRAADIEKARNDLSLNVASAVSCSWC